MTTEPLAIRLFGPFHVIRGGAVLPPLRSQKGRWLLALLALRLGREVDRSWLAGTLWPDSDEERAMGSLRRALTDLRAALGEQAACIAAPGARTISLEPAGVWVDVAVFDHGVGSQDAGALREAIALYRGPLLEGCAEDWVFLERETRALGLLAALDRLAALRLADGDDREAEALLRRAVAEAPLREGSWRALMGLLAARGDYAAAGDAYRELRLHLGRELGAQPALETSRLHHQIRADGQARAAATALPATEAPPAGEAAVGAAPVGGAPVTDAAGQRAPVRLPAAPRLPEPIAPLLGRARELEAIAGALQGSRLVTLTGPGGIGKTRLALRAAALAAPRYPDGARFVALSARGDEAGVLEAVADALGARPSGSTTLQEAVSEALAGATTLLVLDNCEHLAAAAAQVTEALLMAAPGLVVLATSRAPLGVSGELVHRVPALELPADGAPLSEALASPAAQLLLARAGRAEVPPEEAPALVAACRRLDGIPLALELAAARLSVLSLPQLATRLDERFCLLTGGARTAPPRHQTLRATLDWSYDLLPPPDRAALCALSVFAGPFDAALAAPILDPTLPAEAALEAAPVDVIDTLSRLVDQSLLVATPPQLRMLESTRAYARERLRTDASVAARHAAAPVAARHAAAVVALVRAAEPHLRGGGGPWLARLGAAHAEIIAAAEWLLGGEAGPEGVRAALQLTGAAWRFWAMQSHITAGRRLLEAALHRGAPYGPELREASLHGAGTLAWMQGDMDAALLRHGQALIARRTIGDLRGVAWSLTNLGIVAMFTGSHDRAAALHDEALGTFRAEGDGLGVCAALMNRAIVATYQGELPRAQALHEAALAEARALRHEETIARSLSNLAYVEHRRGQIEAAEEHMREALAAQHALGDRYAVIFDLEVLARNALAAGRPERAALLLGAAAEARRTLGIAVRPTDREALDAAVSATRAALGDAFDAAWARGVALDLDDATREAVAVR